MRVLLEVISERFIDDSAADYCRLVPRAPMLTDGKHWATSDERRKSYNDSTAA